MASNGLSDKAVAVFAFAAYHQLTAGEVVTEVIGVDGQGHKADPEAVAELEKAGLATKSGDRVSFTPDGQSLLARCIQALQQAAR